MTEKPHSAEHFTPSRNLWWHDDYLDLLARRLELHRCRAMLDLGAGVGHWTAMLMARCAAGAAVTVVDREPAWVERLEQRFAGQPGFRAIRADIADLAVADGAYDLVTCQTLLLHVVDVPGALGRMRDALAPGGLLLLAEPNNFANRMQMSSVVAGLSPAEYGALAAFWWAFEKGRETLGLGREWIAELLPAMIADAGFENLEVFNNDRTWPWYPPYATPEQALSRAEKAERARSGEDRAEREETRRCVLAGGYDEAAFERGWALVDALERREARAIAGGTFASAGAGSLCVFAARKRGQPR